MATPTLCVPSSKSSADVNATGANGNTPLPSLDFTCVVTQNLNGCVPYALESGRYAKRYDDVLRLIEDRVRIACEREKRTPRSTLSYTLWADVNSAGSYPQHISLVGSHYFGGS